MDLNATYNDFPWEMITAAEYNVYRTADAQKGLEALRLKMGREAPGAHAAVVVPLRRWAAVAAAVILVAGTGWWLLTRASTIDYQTAALERKFVTLPDGSTVVLQPQTHLRLTAGYNKSMRTVLLLEGKAKFDVAHNVQRPFEVDMDGASVKDIGTSFTIEKTADSIKVSVASGEVAFLAKHSGQSTQMKAGGSACLNKGGDLKVTTPTVFMAPSLRFDNATLSTVIETLEAHFGTRIQLDDPTLAQKRLTVHLDGESLEDAINTVCASFNLNSTVSDSTYILKAK